MDNKRKEPRYNAFWKVYKEEITWGYLLDLSETGLRVWLNKEEDIENEEFVIRVNPPREINIEPIDFGITKIWVNPNKSQRFNEIGCRFKSLDKQQEHRLNELIVYFKQYNDKEEAIHQDSSNLP